MSVLEIRRWPDPILSQVCRPVTGDVTTLALNMLEAMYAAPGRGLAAPQVGHALRLFVMDIDWKQGVKAPFVCINPAILERSESLVSGEEGCLSIPGITANVVRAEWILLGWTDENGVARDEKLTGFAAVCAQHEMDHLDGLVTFDRVDPEARAALEAAYDG